VLVVVCHPVPGSFVRAAAAEAVSALLRAGREVRVIDLDEEGFDPVLGRDEWRSYLSAPAVHPHAEHLRWADELVLCYPTWFGAQPAMLKGWIERVWSVGVAYDLPEGATRIRGLLRNIRRITVITSHGSTKFLNSVQGEPGKRVALRGLRVLCGVTTRGRWIAFYGNDVATAEDRTRFLARVGADLSR
jgi:putative NADPH-quinone reductase